MPANFKCFAPAQSSRLNSSWTSSSENPENPSLQLPAIIHPSSCRQIKCQSVSAQNAPGANTATVPRSAEKSCSLNNSPKNYILQRKPHSLRRRFISSSSSCSWLAVRRLRARAFSLPFLTWMLQPCNFKALVSALLGRMPGKSLAVYTVNTSLITSVSIGEDPPTWRFMGSIRISTNRRRYLPCVRHDKSGKQKKHPSLSCSSLATEGEATSWPMSLRVVRRSGCMSAVSSLVPSAFHNVQCTTFSEYRSSSCSATPVLGSVTSSWMIGGGSMTLLSRSPNPHALAATGCCRTRSSKFRFLIVSANVTAPRRRRAYSCSLYTGCGMDPGSGVARTSFRGGGPGALGSG